MTVEYFENPKTKTVEITASGHYGKEDFDAVVDKMQRFIDANGKIRLIEIINSFEGFDPSLLWSGLKFDLRNIKHISHVAVVSDVGWISPMSKAAGAFLSTKLRTFDLDQIEDARRWIASAD